MRTIIESISAKSKKETIQENKKSLHYLFVPCEIGKSFEPIKNHLKVLRGFYNGAGYCFDIKHEKALRGLLARLNDVHVLKLPMISSSFDHFKLSHQASYFQEKLIEIESEMTALGNKMHCKNSTHAKPEEQEKYFNLITKKECLEKSIKWSRSMEETLKKLKNDSHFELLSIEELDKNSGHSYYDKPRKKESLLQCEKKEGREEPQTAPFLHKGIIAMLVAEGGVGKSHFCAQLALSVISGIPFLTQFQVTCPGAVVFIAGEGDEEDLRRLFYKTAEPLKKLIEKNESRKKKGRPLFQTDGQELRRMQSLLYPKSVHGTDAMIIHENRTPTHFYKNLLKELVEKEPKKGWQLIILDPGSRFFGIDSEKDNAAATGFISLLENMSGKLKGNPTILFTHHRNKSGTKESFGQTDARGSSALVDGVRFMASLTVDKNDKHVIYLDVPKTNFTPLFQRAKLKKNWEGIIELKEFVDG